MKVPTYRKCDDEYDKTHGELTQDSCEVLTLLLKVFALKHKISDAQSNEDDEAARKGQHKHKELANNLSDL